MDKRRVKGRKLKLEGEYTGSQRYAVHTAPMRSRVEIMASILQAILLSSEGLRKTRLMYRCNLSFRQLKTYLRLLVEKKFVSLYMADESKARVEVYKITQEGLDFLKSYNELRKRLNEERLAR